MKSPLRSRILTAAIAATLLFSATVADAAPGAPPFIDYQGRVLDGNGAPLAPNTPANFEIEFRIYENSTGPGVIWAEKQLVTVLNGQFSVRLGEGQPITAAGGGQEGSVGHASPGLPGAFGDSSRYLGVTVKIPGQTPGEITPRLAFLSSPFSFVSASAGNLVQAPGTQSNLTVGSIAYSTQTLSTSAAVSGASRTVLVDAAAGTPSSPVTATLPVNGAQKEILIAKTDASTKQVAVAPPAGGNINGSTASIRLKVKGESVTLQNVGGNDWWIVNDNRDKTPVGTIISFGAGTPPPGYLTCDGATLLRADYPDLFAAVGPAWGSTNASNFNAPWLSGRFLRGVDPGGATIIDEDGNNRTAGNPGGASGRAVGSYQTEALKSHNHGVTDNGHDHGSNAGGGYGGLGLAHSNGNNTATAFDNSANELNLSVNPYALDIYHATTGISIQNFGGAETRPDNAYVLFCIKY
jgi:hypothetical protein